MSMFHIFHKWPKWSKPKRVEYSVSLAIVPGTWVNGDEPTKTVVRWVQERVCETCGKYDRRLINAQGHEE